VRLIVLADVLKLESLWQIEIKLHGGQLPQPADRILNLYVNLWTVKRRFTFNSFVSKILVLERFS
jgi:hypothetical protein